MQTLKRSLSKKEVDELVQILDTDNDGRVSVLELLKYAEKKGVGKEVEALAKQTKSV